MMGPIEVVGEVAVAAGPGAAGSGAAGHGAAHRAWPSLERTEDGGLVVAYKVGPDHHKTDDGVVWVARSEDGGLTWPFRRPVVAEPGWDVFTHHGLTRLRDGNLLLHCVRARHLGAEEAGDAGEGAFFARGAFIRSEDGGRTWRPHGPPLEMPFISATGRGFCYGKIQELAGGALIVPFYGTPADRTDELQRVLAIVRSDDGGRSWREYSFVSADPSSPSAAERDRSAAAGRRPAAGGGASKRQETSVLRLVRGRRALLERARAHADAGPVAGAARAGVRRRPLRLPRTNGGGVRPGLRGEPGRRSDLAGPGQPVRRRQWRLRLPVDGDAPRRHRLLRVLHQPAPDRRRPRLRDPRTHPRRSRRRRSWGANRSSPAGTPRSRPRRCG